MWTVGFRFDCHCLRYLGGNEVTRNAYHLLWGWNSQLASYLITGMNDRLSSRYLLLQVSSILSLMRISVGVCITSRVDSE